MRMAVRWGRERPQTPGSSRWGRELPVFVQVLALAGCIDTSGLIFDIGAGSASGTGGAGGSGGAGGGAPPGCNDSFEHPAASSLASDFGGSAPPGWVDNNADCTSYQGGELAVSPPPATEGNTSYCKIYTAGFYHLTCDAVTLRVSSIANTASGVHTFVYLSPLGGDEVQAAVLVEGGGFLLGMGGNYVPVENGTYDPSDDLWWRIGEREGDLMLETSPDGVRWRVRGTARFPAAVDAVQIELGAGAYQPNIPIGEARFDCYNVPPEACP
jgi:hypothetical protein